jgi:hypothetical protein
MDCSNFHAGLGKINHGKLFPMNLARECLQINEGVGTISSRPSIRLDIEGRNLMPIYTDRETGERCCSRDSRMNSWSPLALIRSMTTRRTCLVYGT